MAQPLQHDPTALIFGLPAARTANIVANNAPSGSEHSDAIISVPLVQNIRQVNQPALSASCWGKPLAGYISGNGRGEESLSTQMTLDLLFNPRASPC